MSLGRWIFNKRYSITCIMTVVASRICFLSRNAMIYRSKDMLMMFSICLLSLAVRHNKLLKSKTRKKRTKWIEVF